MLNFKSFITEATGTTALTTLPGVPENLHNFLFHLSGPSDPTGKSLNEAAEYYDRLEEAERNDLLEVELQINKRVASPTSSAQPKFNPDDAAHPAMNLPKTRAMIDQAREDIPAGNVHKRIGEGFQSALKSMANESPKESRDKLRESNRVLGDFAKSRGFKGKFPLLGENMKTEKSSGEGVLTKGLTLAPHTTSGLHGFNSCVKSSTECRAGCLGLTAGGNRQYPDAALSSKVIRTHFLAKHPEHAARILDNEIGNHVKNAAKKGMKPGVRLNVTSDISWEKHAPQLFDRHPAAQFYDYTKLSNRVGHPDLPKNYHLTLSHTGTDHDESNDKAAVDTLKRGHVVAMVYHRGKKIPHPTHVEDVQTGNRYPIVNGDKDDNTFDRHESIGRKEGTKGHGVVSGLQLKGIKNEEAGKFANPVDKDGIIRINK